MQRSWELLRIINQYLKQNNMKQINLIENKCQLCISQVGEQMKSMHEREWIDHLGHLFSQTLFLRKNTTLSMVISLLTLSVRCHSHIKSSLLQWLYLGSGIMVSFYCFHFTVLSFQISAWDCGFYHWKIKSCSSTKTE